ncbi:phosphatidylserine decarboxylase [Adhaeretor mobilis]|uniref:phosphatidylserine decarboxylase n=1 Tax=Adhaeretor mobilis TaxID=1930276 RepID=UPI001C54C7D2|nr:phosphatidylserine decarboxylase [Adhaeretor mobilis]
MNKLPDNIKSVQPGGGKCYSIELAWGRLRRWYLKLFCKSYVDKMAALRLGDTEGAPHEILDPRDLKYCCNLCTAHWKPEDDPFRSREDIPFARWGLAELQLMGWPLFWLTVATCFLPGWWKCLAVVPGIILCLIVYFFRDPHREVPDDTDAIVSPADGTIAEITELDHYDFLDGPALRIGIFLSIFNVHINRSPRDAKVVDLNYKPGEFLNAMNPESAIRNEFMWIGFQDDLRPAVRFAVRQISGLIARRIVCALKPGQSVQRGEKFGMIKLGSRTEIVLPRDAVKAEVEIGQKIQAGSTIIARFVD